MRSYFLLALVLTALLIGTATAETAYSLQSLKQKAGYAIGADLASKLKRADFGVNAKALIAGFVDSFVDGKMMPNDTQLRKSWFQLSAALNEGKPVGQDVNYAIGADIGSELKRLNIDLDHEAMAAGLADRFSGGKMLLSDEQMTEAALRFLKEQELKQAANRETESEKNIREGKACLLENAKKDGVKVTPSGLQYKVLKSGKAGKSPKATDYVKVDFRAAFISGRVFDSSLERGAPIMFPLVGVIRGWVEGLQLMNEGDKFQFLIPSNLAYGEGGAGNKIGPNCTLLFEVELLSIVTQAEYLHYVRESPAIPARVNKERSQQTFASFDSFLESLNNSQRPKIQVEPKNNDEEIEYFRRKAEETMREAEESARYSQRMTELEFWNNRPRYFMLYDVIGGQ